MAIGTASTLPISAQSDVNGSCVIARGVSDGEELGGADRERESKRGDDLASVHFNERQEDTERMTPMVDRDGTVTGKVEKHLEN
jgi:hypothetical protein